MDMKAAYEAGASIQQICEETGRSFSWTWSQLKGAGVKMRRGRLSSTQLAVSLHRRFEAAYCPEPNSGCWLWTKARDAPGYGKIVTGRKVTKAHRVSYEMHKGKIGKGLSVCHTCDTPPCVNPDHLFLGTVKENWDDCASKGRHVYGTRHAFAKLTDGRVREARRLAKRGVPYSDLANRYGTSWSAVRAAVQGVTWKHVPMEASPD